MYDTFQKTLIAWAFNHYIAYYYFDNINVTQLKVAFEKGEIELENLPIKRDALRHLKLPWDVVSGTVGKLSIRIPLFSLLTESWVIRINNLSLIVAPRSQHNGIGSKQRAALSRNSTDNRDDYGTTNLSQNEILKDSLGETSFTEGSVKNDSTTNDYRVQTLASAEESKLAEFYSLFSATVSSVVKDIYKNIKLEIQSMTLLFEGFTHGIVKFSSDYLLFHRPETERKINLDNVSIYFSSIGPHTWTMREDLLKINLTSCNLELCDVSTGRNQTSLEINSETDITGTLYIVGLTKSPIPLSEFLLEDFRMLFFSADGQQDGSIFARVSCCHFNREASAWDTLLEPWPFNLSWDRRKNHKRYSLTSDELAEFTMSSAFLDLIDTVRRRILTESMQLKLRPIITTPSSSSQLVTLESEALYVLHNETNYRLFYSPAENSCDTSQLSEGSKSVSPTISNAGDSLRQTRHGKISVCSRSSADDSSSTDVQQSTQWSAVNPGDSVHFEVVQSIHIRVDGWKTLSPIPLNKTGQYLRKAWSDRVKNEDTHIVVSIELEDKSARKIITVRSALRQDPIRKPVENYRRSIVKTTNRQDIKSSPRTCKLSHYNILLAGSLSRWPKPRFHNRDKSELNFMGPGFRFTLVDNKREKILRISFEKVAIKTTVESESQVIDCSIQDICIESALPDCIKTIVLDRASSTDKSPALRLIMDRILGRSFGTFWFRQVQLSMCELAMNVEERLFLKLVEFISFSRRTESKSARDLSRNPYRNLNQDRVSKYYFDMLRIDLEGLRVSCFKSPNLSEALQKLRTQLNLTFYNFEDARVHLSPYLRMNVSQTWRGVYESVSRFYKEQVSEQAPWILIQQLYNQIRNYLPNMIPYLYEEVYSNLFY